MRRLAYSSHFIACQIFQAKSSLLPEKNGYENKMSEWAKNEEIQNSFQWNRRARVFCNCEGNSVMNAATKIMLEL